MNSTVSFRPDSSTALAPAALYLEKMRMQVGELQAVLTYPKEIPESPCSNFIFPSRGNFIVSAPISNI